MMAPVFRLPAMSSDYELAAVPLQVSLQQWIQPPASLAVCSLAVKRRL
jgi:hypothetical protein